MNMETLNVNGQMGMFEDLMDDSENTGMVDPLSDYSYDPSNDFEQFQNENPDNTKITKEGAVKLDDPFELNFDKDDDSENFTESDYGLIYDTLKHRGFNPDAIKFENENGEIENVSFKDLSKEDQISLLNSTIEEEDYSSQLDDNEISAINFLRENNLTLEELAKAIREKTISEINTPEPTYSVDDFSDDELYLIDFKNQYGEEFTEEQLLDELERAKSNPELFEKKIAKTRSDYKNYEDQLKANEAAEAEQAQAQKQQEYIDSMINVARNTSNINNIVELDDDDREEILQFMFDTDGAGRTQLQKAMDDPETVFRMAWFLKHGDQTLNEMQNYYKEEIAKLSKQTSQNTKKVESVVINKNNQSQHTTQRRPRRIEDLY